LELKKYVFTCWRCGGAVGTPAWSGGTGAAAGSVEVDAAPRATDGVAHVLFNVKKRIRRDKESVS